MPPIWFLTRPDAAFILTDPSFWRAIKLAPVDNQTFTFLSRFLPAADQRDGHVVLFGDISVIQTNLPLVTILGFEATEVPPESIIVKRDYSGQLPFVGEQARIHQHRCQQYSDPLDRMRLRSAQQLDLICVSTDDPAALPLQSPTFAEAPARVR